MLNYATELEHANIAPYRSEEDRQGWQAVGAAGRARQERSNRVQTLEMFLLPHDRALRLVLFPFGALLMFLLFHVLHQAIRVRPGESTWILIFGGAFSALFLEQIC